MPGCMYNKSLVSVLVWYFNICKEVGGEGRDLTWRLANNVLCPSKIGLTRQLVQHQLGIILNPVSQQDVFENLAANRSATKEKTNHYSNKQNIFFLGKKFVDFYLDRSENNTTGSIHLNSEYEQWTMFTGSNLQQVWVVESSSYCQNKQIKKDLCLMRITF